MEPDQGSSRSVSSEAPTSDNSQAAPVPRDSAALETQPASPDEPAMGAPEIPRPDAPTSTSLRASAAKASPKLKADELLHRARELLAQVDTLSEKALGVAQAFLVHCPHGNTGGSPRSQSEKRSILDPEPQGQLSNFKRAR